MTDSPTDEVVSRLGSRIRAEREDQGLSLTELSELSGVGRGTVSDLERTARTPSLETLAKIASGLGVPIPTLLDEQLTERPLAPFGPGTDLEVRVLAIWTEGDTQVEVYRMRLWGPLRKSPTRKGARGYVTVISGALSAGAAATPRAITAGGQIAFAADQPHVLIPTTESAHIVLIMRYPVER